MQKLIHIREPEICIENGKARYNLYNSKGGLYAVKGCVLPSRWRSMDFYVPQSELPEEVLKSQLPKAKAMTSDSEPADDIKDENERRLTQKVAELVNPEVVEAYERAMDDLISAFHPDSPPEQIVTQCEDAIEQSFALDYADLYLCNRAFASFDSCTARHSFSVYCLFCDVLFSIRKQKKSEHFFELFKQKNYSVNFASDAIKKYALGALLHDIGKIRIPESVLNKPGALTTQEFALIQKHVAFGLGILGEIGESSREMRQMIANHHPAYPVFPGEENSPLVQILSIVDMFDACRTVRPYKKALSVDECIEILQQNLEKFYWDEWLLDIIIENTIKRFEMRYAALEAVVSCQSS